MTVKCPICDAAFRTKAIMQTHYPYCQILDKMRGKSYLILNKKTDSWYQFIHINEDAKLDSLIIKKIMYVLPEELYITGGFHVFRDGSGFDGGFRLINLLALNDLIAGRNDYFYVKEAKEEDLQLARKALMYRFEELSKQ